VLSANDVGTTGGHQGGIVVPKLDRELLAFLPQLDASTLNPSTWIDCETPEGALLRLRFVYYNNRLHVARGTRNEYRITHLSKFLKDSGARAGDHFEIARDDGSALYRIRVIASKASERQAAEVDDGPFRIKLTTRWERVH